MSMSSSSEWDSDDSMPLQLHTHPNPQPSSPVHETTEVQPTTSENTPQPDQSEAPNNGYLNAT